MRQQIRFSPLVLCRSVHPSPSPEVRRLLLGTVTPRGAHSFINKYYWHYTAASLPRAAAAAAGISKNNNSLINLSPSSSPYLFADYFKELLVESKKEFHAMFKRTYGAIYEQNSYVFSDLFHELEAYYTWGQVDLKKVLDEFFNKLYQKMFTVLNSQFSYDDK